VQIFQHVIGATIGCRLFGGNLRLVFDVPIGLAEQAVDDDPGVGFV
jgi:hypothetical protein